MALRPWREVHGSPCRNEAVMIDPGAWEGAENGTRPRDATRFTYQILGQTNLHSPTIAPIPRVVPHSQPPWRNLAYYNGRTPYDLRWSRTMAANSSRIKFSSKASFFWRTILTTSWQQALRRSMFMVPCSRNSLSSLFYSPLIDLVKTPGRKKIAKKVKLAPSKLNGMVLSSLDVSVTIRQH